MWHQLQPPRLFRFFSFWCWAALPEKNGKVAPLQPRCPNGRTFSPGAQLGKTKKMLVPNWKKNASGRSWGVVQLSADFSLPWAPGREVTSQIHFFFRVPFSSSNGTVQETRQKAHQIVLLFCASLAPRASPRVTFSLGLAARPPTLCKMAQKIFDFDFWTLKPRGIDAEFNSASIGEVFRSIRSFHQKFGWVKV